MRPTGQLHLGHLVGALGNWARLQAEHDCFYFVADWHALTSDFADTSQLTSFTYENVADWIGAGGLLNGPSHLGLHPRPGPEQPNGARLGIRSADRPRSPAERGCDCGRNGGRIIIPIGVDRCAAEFDDTQRRDRWQMNNLAERG